MDTRMNDYICKIKGLELGILMNSFAYLTRRNMLGSTEKKVEEIARQADFM
jgi:predicted nucleotidyltransferase